MASELTGQVAEMIRIAKGTEIMNDFLCTGTALLRARDLEGVLEEVERTRERFARYGLDVQEFVERSR